MRVGWGGAFCGGEQYISWISGRDLAAAVIFLLERKDLDGPFNLCAPEPIPNREFMARLRAELGVSAGLPVASWMATIGAYFLQTDPELMRKSRRVVPRLLLEAGFEFQDATWSEAVGPMVRRWAERRETGRLNPVLGSVQA